jgi:aminoglycoside phosphotransferase (APT) family kinase protein
LKSNTWPRLPTGVADVIRQRATKLLPTKLPLGLVHGDFAPRNIFIGAGSHVTVIDSLGQYRAPIYEDLAYLLVELLSGATRLRHRGLPRSTAELASMRAELLSGYGIADDVILSIFELRALLDKWRSLAQRSRSSNLRGRATRMTDTLRRFIVARRVNDIIRQL